MKFFLDTSVLVAALVRRHPQHVRGFSVFRSVVEGEHEGYVSTHTLAEFYAVITRLPVRPAVQSSEAMLMIERDILAHCRLIELDTEDYRTTLAKAAENGWRGGSIYDALLLRCAAKADPDRIYTFNVADFVRLAPELANRICAP